VVYTTGTKYLNESCDSVANTPLHLAAQCGNIQIVQILLDAKPKQKEVSGFI